MARRLNGTSQWFDLTVNGVWRRSNYNWFFGGWVRFVSGESATAGYVVDFGRYDLAIGAGGARNRLLYDGANDRIITSSCLTDGSFYYEHEIGGFIPDPSLWYYVGYAAKPSGETVGYRDSQRSTWAFGPTITPPNDNVCWHLRFGGRANATVSGLANVDLADWIWCSDSIPTEAQIGQLVAGAKPANVSGLAYHHHWAFDQTGNEPSLVSAATLTATNNPTVVAGPSVGSTAPLPIIFV